MCVRTKRPENVPDIEDDMKVAYFDCFAGISGDMTLGALLELGVEFRAVEAELRKLGLEGYILRQSRVVRSGIAATKFDVVTHDEKSHGRKHPSHAPDHHVHRSLSEILSMIENSTLSAHAKQLSCKIFERLGRAEALVHNVSVEKVHFHEVGAVDSIVDVVGAAICLDWLGFDRVVSSPINVGAGFVDCAHGKFPVPGPAVAELLKGIPIYCSGPEEELTTPTGAAIISTLTTEFRRLRNFQSRKIGYGAGSREFENFPNVLRILVGEELLAPVQETVSGDEIVSVLEANIDDMNPQIYGYFLEKALSAEALDVYLTAVQMKKNRPGQCLTVLCHPSNVEALTQLIFSETTTIGVRIHETRRQILNRTRDSVDTQFGKIQIKISRLNGSVLNAVPEFEDCRRIAREQVVPLKEVLAEANAKIRTLKF